jgi:hypothetical protein
VRGQTVWILECDDLCAAVSESALGSTQLEDLLVYAKVVEAFNRCEAIVPMRFGCVFHGPLEVRVWMRRNAGKLRALLRRLDGCVEMGVRALLLEPTPPSTAARAAATGAAKPGAAYLAARRTHWSLAQRCDRLAESVREALGGRFRECIVESGWRGALLRRCTFWSSAARFPLFVQPSAASPPPRRH